MWSACQRLELSGVFPRPCEMAFRINQNRWNPTESNGIPQNPTESHGIQWESNGIPPNPRNPTESTESHRIHGIPPNPRNPMELRRISDDSESRTKNWAVADPLRGPPRIQITYSIDGSRWNPRILVNLTWNLRTSSRIPES